MKHVEIEGQQRKQDVEWQTTAVSTSYSEFET